MLSYSEAIQQVLDHIKPLPATEVPLEEGLGKVLAEPVHSRFDLPPTDNSAMDGYAFAYQSQGGNDRLPVCGFLPAGLQQPKPIAAGSAIKIMTGAPMPPGCDTVLPIEDVRQDGEQIHISKAPRQGQHVRYQGEEIRADQQVLPAGTLLRAGEIGLLAATGHSRLRVIPAPRVAVLSTGDELVAPGEIPGPGQVVNSNLPLLCARLREEDCQPLAIGMARDERQSLKQMLEQGLSRADLLITTGGVSVGDHDLVQETLEQINFERIFWKVQIKPGKPVLFGRVGETPVLGLPGNPASSAATFELFARPAIRQLAGRPDPIAPRLPARLGMAVKQDRSRERFIWGRLERGDDHYRFLPGDRQFSGQNRSLQGVQALYAIPMGKGKIPADSAIEVLMLRLPPGTAVY